MFSPKYVMMFISGLHLHLGRGVSPNFLGWHHEEIPIPQIFMAQKTNRSDTEPCF